MLDTLHATSISVYEEMGFTPTLTQDTTMETMCRNLMGLFEKYHSRINTELPIIKKELGDSFLVF